MAQSEPGHVKDFTIQSATRIAFSEIPEDCLVRTAYEFWRGLVPAPALPARVDFTPLDIPRDLLPWLFLMEVLEEPARPSGLDYRFRLNGTSNVALVGRDATGKLATEIFGRPQHLFMLDSFDLTVTGREPTYWTATAPHDRIGSVELWRGLFPLAADREHVNMLLGVAVPKNGPILQ